MIHWCSWCGQDVKGVALESDDRDRWRRFVARPYGPNGLKKKKKKIIIIIPSTNSSTS